MCEKNNSFNFYLIPSRCKVSDPSGSSESVRVRGEKYLGTLLLLKLTITPFCSVGAITVLVGAR